MNITEPKHLTDKRILKPRMYTFDEVRELIKEVLNECIGEEEDVKGFSEAIFAMGYNKKRNEIIDLKNKYLMEKYDVWNDIEKLKNDVWGKSCDKHTEELIKTIKK